MIAGTAQVGEPLIAVTSAIMDAEGVPATFTYRWVRVDAADDEIDIGTNSSSYTPEAADAGSTIRVYVSFIDKAGNTESPPASEKTAVVMPAIAGIGPVWSTTMTVGAGTDSQRGFDSASEYWIRVVG